MDAGGKKSADEISAYADLRKLTAQRKEFRKENWKILAENHEKSVFYQLDLQQAAEEYGRLNLKLPQELDEQTPLLTRIADTMFRARTMQIQGAGTEEVKRMEEKAFALMRNGLVGTVNFRQQPKLSVYEDQIVWGKKPCTNRPCRRLDGYATLQPHGGRKCSKHCYRTERTTTLAGVCETIERI